jgi:branched-subunit amino acid ABC-type transport system permease component
VSWTVVFDQFVIGLSSGAIFVLVSLGLTMIFGMLNVLNFTHGVLYMLGAYVGYVVVRATGNFWLALIAAPLLVAVVGVVVEQISIRPLGNRPHLIQFLATYGLTLVIEQLVRFVYGNGAYSIARPDIFAGTIALGPVVAPKYRLFLILAAVLICGGLGLLVSKTRWGAVIRATSEDREMAALLRINTRTVSTAVFAGGSALAALGGVLAAPELSVNPSMGDEIIVIAFLVVIVGGLGSLRGAILSGFIIGQSSSLGLLLVARFSDLLTFGLMGLLLMIKPVGLFGRTEGR